MGLRHGLGTFYNLDGTKFYRSFANDDPEGKGKYYFTDGRVYEGILSKDNLPEGIGTINYPNG